MKRKLVLVMASILISIIGALIVSASDDEEGVPSCLKMVYSTTYATGMERGEEEFCGNCPFGVFASITCVFVSDPEKKCRLEECRPQGGGDQ